MPGLPKLDLYAAEQMCYPVVEQGPDQAENETEDPMEDGKENNGPDAEYLPGEGIGSLRVRRFHGRA